MTLIDFLTKLRKLNIKINLVDNQLKISGNNDILTREILTEIKSRKEEIINFLSENSDEQFFDPVKWAEKKEYYELSSVQKRLYFIQQLNVNSIAYNMFQKIPINENVDIEEVEHTVKQIINRHEILRTSFKEIENEPVQVIHDKVDFSVEEILTTDLDIEQKINTFIKPFELSKAPLIHVGIIKSEKRNFLLFDIHHIICDYVTLRIIKDEVLLLHEKQKLLSLLFQYKDYSEWQKYNKQNPQIKKQEQFWVNLLSNELPILNLPYDYYRLPLQRFNGAYVSFFLDRDKSDFLKEITVKEGVTLFMTIISIFKVLLSKLSNQEDIIVGVPIEARRQKGLDNIAGMFVNTISLRSYPEGHKTYLEFLREIKDITLQSYENQEYQFEDIVNTFSIAREPGRNPIFDVMFSMLNEERTIDITTYDKTDHYEHYEWQAKFDLTLTAIEHGDGNILMTFEYSTDLFKPATINFFIKYFFSIIDQISNDQKKKISGIQLMDEMERKKLVQDFNNTKVKYPENKTVHSFFEETAKKVPDKIALTDNSKNITYGELNKYANNLAKQLKTEGVTANSIIGIAMDISFEMIISILAILKAGGCYVPIDKTTPDARINYIVRDSGMEKLIVDKSFDDGKISGCEVIKIDLNSFNDGISKNLTNINKSTDIVYIIYTSGTTGVPKGVLIKHKNVINYIYWAKSYYLQNGRQNFPLYSPLSFDLTVTSIFIPLFTGNQINIYNSKEKSLILYSIIEKDSDQIIKLTPSHFKMLSEYTDKNNSVESLIFGGENLEKDLAYNCGDLFKKTINVYNEYGPTEATVGCMIYKVNITHDTPYSSIPIGKPINNTQIYILDKYLQPLPKGVAGELYIGGDSLALGYLNNPELTFKSFVNSPFDSEKLYKTGDTAKFVSNDEILFVGRSDQQVKIRGYRIEISEIEYYLKQIDDIKNVVVVPKLEEGEFVLYAYFTSDNEISASEIREYLSLHIPQYMIPTVLLKVDEIPLTSRGKVDVKKLDAFENNVVVNNFNSILPADELEVFISKLWKDQLKIDRVGIHDNFFQIGGNSFMMLKIFSELKKTLDKEIHISVLFRYPTINSLVNFLKSDTDKEFISEKEMDDSVDLLAETTKVFLSED